MSDRLVIPIAEKDIVIDYAVRVLCRKPYPGHPNGCPNWNKRDTCPPKAPLLKQISRAPYQLVAIKFDLDEHAERMKKKHPEWSDKQARCVLYWQGRVNKQLAEVCRDEAYKIKNSIVLICPEAYGVDVFKTCEKIGLSLETKAPHHIVWKIALIGTKNA